MPNERHWHDKPTQQVLDELGASAHGLDGEAVAQRRAAFGPNRMPAPPRRGAAR